MRAVSLQEEDVFEVERIVAERKVHKPHLSYPLYSELCELCVLPIAGVYYLEAAR